MRRKMSNEKRANIYILYLIFAQLILIGTMSMERSTHSHRCIECGTHTRIRSGQHTVQENGKSKISDIIIIYFGVWNERGSAHFPFQSFLSARAICANARLHILAVTDPAYISISRLIHTYTLTQTSSESSFFQRHCSYNNGVCVRRETFILIFSFSLVFFSDSASRDDGIHTSHPKFIQYYFKLRFCQIIMSNTLFYMLLQYHTNYMVTPMTTLNA